MQGACPTDTDVPAFHSVGPAGLRPPCACAASRVPQSSPVCEICAGPVRSQEGVGSAAPVTRLPSAQEEGAWSRVCILPWLSPRPTASEHLGVPLGGTEAVSHCLLPPRPANSMSHAGGWWGSLPSLPAACLACRNGQEPLLLWGAVSAERLAGSLLLPWPSAAPHGGQMDPSPCLSRGP